jgi:hypothetical protein
LAEDSETVPRPAEASPAEGAVSTTPPIELKPWRVVASAIGLIGLVLSVIWLITSPGTREGTSALAALFFLSAAAIVGALKPYWERWKPAQQIGGAAGAAAGATVVFLALLQILPSNPTTTASIPPNATASAPPSRASPIPIGAKECSFLHTSPVVVQKIFSADGQPGISGDLRVLVVVNTAPTEGHTYWLFSKVTNGNGRFVYVAKAQVPGSLGQYQLPVRLPNSSVGSVRDIFVADGGPDALSWLQENNANDGIPQWDEHRNDLHGVTAVSNVCTIKKDRL